MKLGIVGSRRRNTTADKRIIQERILALKPEMLISGGCPKGADKFAEELARQMSIPITVFHPKPPALSNRYAWVEAYYARNKLIARESDCLIALVAPDRKGGTENTILHFKKIRGEKNLEIL